MNKNRNHTDTAAEGRLLPSLKEIFQIGTTFFITLIAWVFFRSKSIYHAASYINGIFSKSLFSFPEINSKKLIFGIILFISAEWIQRDKQHALQFTDSKPSKTIRNIIYFGLILTILWFGDTQQQFIYFQF